MKWRSIKSLLLSVFIVLFWTGCANVTPIGIGQKNSEAVKKMNSTMMNRNVLVSLASGDSLIGIYDSSKTDTLFISEKISGGKAFGFTELNSISYKSQSLGAATYAGFGMLAALIIWSKTPEGPGIRIGQGVLHWGITIPIASAWIGYKIGRKERFVIQKKK